MCKILSFILITFFCIFWINPAFASADTPEEIFSIQSDKQTLTIYYGPNGNDVQKVSLQEFNDPKDTFPVKEFGRASISSDNKVVVLEVNYTNCCTSYPIPRVLAIYKKDTPASIFLSNQMIHSWKFYKTDGNKTYLVITEGPTHGDCARHLLYDTDTAKVIKESFCSNQQIPIWAK